MKIITTKNEMNSNNETIINDFYQAIANIKREGINDLINFLENSDFFEAPASSRYHLNYKGGLVEHSLNVYKCLLEEINFLGLTKKYSSETLALVSLFHDICKINKYEESTRNVKNKETGQWEQVPFYATREDTFEMGHGALSVYYIQKYMHLTDEEATAIYWHMGAFDLSSYSSAAGLSKCYSVNPLSFALHRADMLATYKIENEHWTKLYENVEKSTSE